MPEPSLERSRRAQKTVDSRQRILDAAVECVIASGYHNTSTLRIQKKAGVTRGRLLHHFPSREMLLIAAAQHLAAQRVQRTTERVVEMIAAPRTDLERVDVVIEQMWQSYHEPHFWAAIELWTAARTEPSIARAVLPAERWLGSVIRASVDEMFGPKLTGRPGYAQLRDVLLSSMRGLALTYGFDPRDPARDPHLSQWKDIARALLQL